MRNEFNSSIHNACLSLELCAFFKYQAQSHTNINDLFLNELAHILTRASLLCVSTLHLLCIFNVLLYIGYHAPLEIYGELLPLSENATLHTLSPDKSVNLCVGKEWYRYPSSFFLPSDK